MHVRTFVIDGRVYSEVTLVAADTREASRHISAQRPIGFTTAKEIREGRRSV